MPLSVDSTSGLAFDYSTANINRTSESHEIEEEIPAQESIEPEVQREFAEAPQEEVDAVFSNTQDAQLNRDILNTFAQDSSNNRGAEFSFSNIDTFQKLLEQSEPQATKRDR